MIDNWSIKDLERLGAEVGVSINKEFLSEVIADMKAKGLDVNGE